MNAIKTSLHKTYSTDGIELDCIVFAPTKPTNKIIIHTHGKEGNFVQNHFINTMGNTYPHHGYAFMTYNNRGHDYMADLLKKTSTGFIWEQGGSVYDILESAKLDLEGIVAFAQQLGYKEIILQGHSLGPHKICYYITHTERNPISRVIFLTTADVRYQFDSSVPNWEHYSLVAKDMIDMEKGAELMPIRLWSNCPISAASFWNYTNPNTNCFVFNGTHPELEYKNFDKVTLPMLVINPENDVATGIPAKKHMDLIKQHSISSDFDSTIVKNAVHNFLGKEEELVSIITNWL